MSSIKTRKLKHRGVFLLVISIMAGAIVACDLFTSDDIRHGTTNQSKGGITFSVGEGYLNWSESADPNIFLSMQTDEIYACCNYSILANTGWVNGKLRVDVLGIYRPGICLTATGPAKFRRQLDLPTGEYELEISDHPKIDRYRLVVTETSIRLQPQETSFTTPKSTLAWRYPRKSFAYVCGTNVETTWIYNDFLDSLLTLPNVTTYKFPEDGTIPYPTSSDGHWRDHPAKYFLYTTEADYVEAGEMLRRYSEQTISRHVGVTICLLNYRNHWFRSWQFTTGQ